MEGASGSGECSWGRRRWPCPALEDTLHRSGPGSGSICRESRLPSPGAHAALPRPPSRRSPQWSPLCQLTNNSFLLHGESGLMVDNSNHEAGSQWRIMIPDLTAWQPPPAPSPGTRQTAGGRWRAGGPSPACRSRRLLGRPGLPLSGGCTPGRPKSRTERGSMAPLLPTKASTWKSFTALPLTSQERELVMGLRPATPEAGNRAGGARLPSNDSSPGTGSWALWAAGHRGRRLGAPHLGQ